MNLTELTSLVPAGVVTLISYSPAGSPGTLMVILVGLVVTMVASIPLMVTVVAQSRFCPKISTPETAVLLAARLGIALVTTGIGIGAAMTV